MIDRERLRQIRERLAAATPGPWRWYVAGNKQDAYLATENSHLVVMDCTRHGLRAAVPRFRNRVGNVMDKFHTWVRNWSTGTIEHPDAQLIAHAPGDLAYLVGLVEQQQARIRELEASGSAVYRLAVDVLEAFDNFSDYSGPEMSDELWSALAALGPALASNSSGTALLAELKQLRSSLTTLAQVAERYLAGPESTVYEELCAAIDAARRGGSDG